MKCKTLGIVIALFIFFMIKFTIIPSKLASVLQKINISNYINNSLNWLNEKDKKKNNVPSHSHSHSHSHSNPHPHAHQHPHSEDIQKNKKKNECSEKLMTYFTVKKKIMNF
ncbi:hypothetical protein D9V80_01295 [Buchnera aphidicola (Thelaxes californica)]|uniref:Uncharacterized protein n=1 Tax=Buchnera aphidicola (Thelaxes californica) TaxID=1315998 RepID=A0A4D6YJR4_9GAMM|nr:hypothetical protein [Buchnera aphidicola]QCI26791.1 hypothetical protein D9V80_01295 [Buchnera aphidicola (Thelaxes californica)]